MKKKIVVPEGMLKAARETDLPGSLGCKRWSDAGSGEINQFENLLLTSVGGEKEVQ